MRLSDLGEKEIIDIRDGSRYSDLYDAELIFDQRTGKIKVILVPENRSRLSFTGVVDYVQIPWNSIKKFGEDIIIVETENNSFY
ncbi:MAG: YlmC/YmxH family sporulation protein [Clostridiales bacterium]|nr:YlmC/YmxH family sporulation protein [Clostridiales bacterium]